MCVRSMLLLIVPFLNEAPYLREFLPSVDAQTQRPDLLLLVDDGSSDGSLETAREFAQARDWASVLVRPARPPEPDRLDKAADLVAFLWALERAPREWSIAAKVDADLRLPSCALAELEGRLL